MNYRCIKWLSDRAAGVLFWMAVGLLMFALVQLTHMRSLLSPDSWMWGKVMWAWVGVFGCIVCAVLAGYAGKARKP